jgi:cyclic beta-1,2-glucan synthetase
MYQAGIEWILGFRLRGTELELDPCIPSAWPGFEIRFRYHTTTYEVAVDNPHAVSSGILTAELDGELLADGARVALHDDGATHRLRVVLGSAPRHDPSAPT